jgi:2,3-bisphosphoglycerate-dependent phosphoglycerate mutase
MSNLSRLERPIETTATSGAVYSWPELYALLTTYVPGRPLHIDIVRHAESVANARGLVAGKWDAELSARGRLQAYRLAWLLKGAPYLFAWSSSLSRTSATLECAARFRRVSFRPMCKDARLDERSLGELEQRPRQFIEAYAKGDLEYAPPGGESYLQLAQRVLSFLVDLRMAIAGESCIVIVTHVGPMRIIAGVLNEIIEPADVLRLSFSHARPYRFDLNTLKWPEFINAKEVLGDRANNSHSRHGRE